jgi:bacteriochlorophyll C20 methyltransferase
VIDLIISDPENPNYDYLTHYLGSVGTDFVMMGFKDHAVYGDLLREIGFEQVRCDEAYDHVLFQGKKPAA